MLPTLRKQLRGVSIRNRSLQDILRTCKEAKEVLSVSPVMGELHNTQIVLLLDQGEWLNLKDRFTQRVHFYNRLDLANIMAELVIENTELSAIITELNLKGYDFTLDDLYITDDGYLTAKPTSLGYIGYHNQLLISNPEIICEGALPSSEVYLTGLWDVEVDGVIVGTNMANDDIYTLLNAGGSFV